MFVAVSFDLCRLSLSQKKGENRNSSWITFAEVSDFCRKILQLTFLQPL